MASTLLAAENYLAGYSQGRSYSGGRPTNWACPLPNFCMFIASDDVCHSQRSTTHCLAGQLRPGADGASGPGWGRANRKGTFENLDFGGTLTVEGSFPFANSPGHPNGLNFLFCGGAVRYLSNTIDGKVYAEIITPAGTSLPAPLRHGLPPAGGLFHRLKREAHYSVPAPRRLTSSSPGRPKQVRVPV